MYREQNVQMKNIVEDFDEANDFQFVTFFAAYSPQFFDYHNVRDITTFFHLLSPGMS